jgi:hypothetical protein
MTSFNELSQPQKILISRLCDFVRDIRKEKDVTHPNKKLENNESWCAQETLDKLNSNEERLGTISTIDPRKRKLIVEAIAFDLDTFLDEDDEKKSIQEQALHIITQLNHYLDPEILDGMKQAAQQHDRAMIEKYSGDRGTSIETRTDLRADQKAGVEFNIAPPFPHRD